MRLPQPTSCPSLAISPSSHKHLHQEALWEKDRLRDPAQCGGLQGPPPVSAPRVSLTGQGWGSVLTSRDLNPMRD